MSALWMPCLVYHEKKKSAGISYGSLFIENYFSATRLMLISLKLILCSPKWFQP